MYKQDTSGDEIEFAAPRQAITHQGDDGNDDDPRGSTRPAKAKAKAKAQGTPAASSGGAASSSSGPLILPGGESEPEI